MLQSSNNGNDPIYYSDQQVSNRPFFHDNNVIYPNSKHEYHQEQPPPPPLTPLSFLQLPSPYAYLEVQDFDVFLHQSHDFLFHHHHHHQQQQQQQQPQPQSLTRSFASDTMVDFNINEDSTNYKKSQHYNNTTSSLDHDHQDQQRKQQMMMMIPRKRSSKRDRHSKINTAQGPRDRRMRLSLKVAREFFDLQDKLHYDKASKTVEWLLVQSRQAIKKLSASASAGGGGGDLLRPSNNCSCSTLPAKSASSTSECEVVSGIDEAAAATKPSITMTAKPSSSSCINNKGIKRAKPSRRTALFHPLARESREKARARARERTKEKQKLWISQKTIDESKLHEESRNEELNQLSRWSTSPFENTPTAGDQESGNNNNNNTMNPCLDMQLPIGSSPEQDRLVLTTTSENMGSWSPSSLNHLYNTGIPQEHQITDLQSLYMQVMGGYN